MYKELSSQLNFPVLEKDIRRFWEERKIFERSVESRGLQNSFIFYEGPPTANGRPGIHHVISRTIKDFVCRLKTMQGYRVERKAGWDTHGLPVEIEVEKELGFSTKEEIEAYGVENFNKKCRESVWKYKQEWDEITKRIGFWIDLEHPYITYENDYIESVWWLLSEFWKKDLIYLGHKILPYCPRCETPLSSHEVSQGYEEVEDPAVFVRVRFKDEEKTSLLVWTTTPWTLISNVALALHPEVKYVKVKVGDEFLILAEARLMVLDVPYEIVQELLGKELIGKDYEPLFDFFQTDKKLYYTVKGEFVSTEEGTGIVHIAPAFGEDDYQVGVKYDLPVLQPVDKSGKFTEEVSPFKHKFVKDADSEIVADLQNRGLLFKSETYLHSYPHCWRCSSPLLYYAKRSWFIRTTAKKDRLIEHNRNVNWYPKEVGEGRFGEWLENNVDWSLSRDRYWGTPLPIWLCGECEHADCIGSVEDLKKRSGLSEDIDLHKPIIDNVEIECPKCKGTMMRTPEVIDCWFDSGSMPVAQWHYPFENQEKFEQSFPADFISEGVDQTRGWFYSLLAIAVMEFDQPCYKMCISHDLILDKMGLKMSKSRGNTVSPAEILDEFGADALRWYLLTVSPPWVPTRFDTEGVREVLRKFLGTLVNVYSFFAIYANIDNFQYDGVEVPVEKRPEIDRWILSSLNGLVARVEELLSRYDLTKSARSLSVFVIDDLSNWYVRRCRRRFWKSEMGEDKRAAYETLYEVLHTLTRLMAPFTPFIADEIYRNLTQEQKNELESVHLTRYPEKSSAAHTFRDEKLEEQMDRVRRVVLQGRALRNESGIKVRQPLSRILVVPKNKNVEHQIAGMANLITEELNVKKVDFVADKNDLIVRKATPLFKELGPRFGKDVKSISDRIRNLGEDEIRELEQKSELEIKLNGKKATIKSSDVEFQSENLEGLVVQQDEDLTVALDVKISEELRLEGLAREFVNRVQNLRKDSGFDVVDRIRIYYQTSGDLQKALERQSEYICNETLAESLSSNSGKAPHSEALKIEGIRAIVGIEKVS
ncbi:isoleucine--tRNA ligase [candidate division KSB1 bacterium]|nr:isoleucine--tRNA ligase [candidate division KSB1 bacterium]NIR68667.1 isoleucine--tRNA ligase [candidate division KSB1 bacterium]NIS27156.1 isoleucine--tRNA ligase [candidate division KSB1 bacterium]NIT74042.1 isoleucine--tRNA ligase [candidate division KSB1 bacterium]NIU27908.1 isoleucine--tRNA ligase [candidate division KSB1 bacterium]